MFLLALKVQLVILVSAFVMVSTVWSVLCLLFLYSRCPPCLCLYRFASYFACLAVNTVGHCQSVTHMLLVVMLTRVDQ